MNQKNLLKHRLKTLFLCVASFILLAGSTPVVAIDSTDREAVNKGMFYYGGETLGQQLCGTVATDNYPILTPEIRDAEALAEAIDEYIDNRNSDSPFNGLGRYFVEGGMRAGINPIFIVALAVKESSLGTDEDTTALQANNGFGRTANTSTQPYVRPVSRAWYAWDSWQASLYSPTYPADGTVSQPDDMFQYIVRRYEGNLERGLEAFLEGRGSVNGYAPSSDGNDVPLYIETVTKVTNDVADLAGEAINLSRVNPGGGSCAGGGDVIETALLYAWPDYRQAPYTNKKPEYEDATQAAMSRGEYVGGLQYPGVDCGGFVTRVMRDSGYDVNYNDQECNTVCQRRYLENNWQEVSVSSTADLQPGDVAIRTGHTFMFVGNQPGFETHVASASVSFNDTGWRAPMAGREDVMDGRLTWYRNTQANEEVEDE